MQNILMFKYLHIIIELTDSKEILEILSLGLYIMQPKYKLECPKIRSNWWMEQEKKKKNPKKKKLMEE